MQRHAIADEHWERFEPFLCPPKQEKRGRPGKDARTVLNGILWILKTGAPWRDMPKTFGAWQTIYKHFNKWAQLSVWQEILAFFIQDADFEWVCIDGSYIKAHQHSAGARKEEGDQAIGRSRGGLTSKIHAAVDALGNPVKILLTGGQTHDSVVATELLENIEAEHVIADKAYDVNAILEEIEGRGSIPVIPAKKNRLKQRFYDKHLYKERHLVENFFCKIKECRRVATRYEKLAVTFSSMVLLAACLIWLR
jgi:transposase